MTSADLAFGFGVEIADDDVIALSAQRAAQPAPMTPPPRRPMVLDRRHAAFPAGFRDQPRFFSFSFLRASSGPMTRTFIASRIVTALSTSWPFEASVPFDR